MPKRTDIKLILIIFILPFNAVATNSITPLSYLYIPLCYNTRTIVPPDYNSNTYNIGVFGIPVLDLNNTADDVLDYMFEPIFLQNRYNNKEPINVNFASERGVSAIHEFTEKECYLEIIATHMYKWDKDECLLSPKEFIDLTIEAAERNLATLISQDSKTKYDNCRLDVFTYSDRGENVSGIEEDFPRTLTPSKYYNAKKN